ncbi:RICIN domain-containing protein [Kitasatospora sp. NPDC048298]|uniref:RICIN domain-containing protein n=1 Tax=Kitasatospora sp. NPDC048298 TaxID=3364049 RepID=UPI003710CEF9
MAIPLRTRLTRRLAALGTALLAVLAVVPLAAAPASAAVTASPICLSGTFQFDYQNAEEGPSKPTRTKPVRNANVELWGREKAGDTAHVLGNYGLTAVSDGGFNLCYTPTTTTTMDSMWVRFYSESTRMWRVLTPDIPASHYTVDSPVQQNVSASVSLGVIKPPAQTSRAWHVLDTLNLLWWGRNNPVSACWSAREPDSNSCVELTVFWSPNSTSGPVYELDNTIYLPAADPDSEHIVLHEGGHFLMDRLYGGIPREGICAPTSPWAASTRPCAWVEGFASAVGAYLLGDNRYVWADGSSTELAYGNGWDNGDAVSGNVAGSLLDLWRKVDGGWQGTAKAMLDHTSSTFADYYKTVRPAAVPPLATTGTTLDLLAKHTIYYGPLPVGDGRPHFLSNGGFLVLSHQTSGCMVLPGAYATISGKGASDLGQQWRLDANADGTVRIHDGCNPSLSLTSSGYPSYRVTVKPSDAQSASQKWQVTRNDDGSLKITDPNTGYVLDTPSNESGKGVMLSAPSATSATQRWTTRD